MGGTCHNRGCIPSKMLIHAANVAETIKHAGKFGIDGTYGGINWGEFTQSVWDQLDEEARQIEEGVRRDENITLFKEHGKFSGPKTLQVGNKSIGANKIFIVGGARPNIPEIKGLDAVSFLTSDEAMRLAQQPEHMAIIGGGYVACELAHFFGALSTHITMLVRGDRLLTSEDEEISAWFTSEFARKYDIEFHTVARHISQDEPGLSIKLSGGNRTIQCDKILIATGRIPNSDILNVEQLGVETDDAGYVKVNSYLETSADEVWALGDIVGIHPFKHTANYQVSYAIWNGLQEKKIPVDYSAIGHAIFSSPQVGTVGMSEQELTREGRNYHVGKYEYQDPAMGEALKENGLVKFLTGHDGEILGCHIVGPDAATLLHEVIVAMKSGAGLQGIKGAVHIHPALSEVVQRAAYSVREIQREPIAN